LVPRAAPVAHRAVELCALYAIDNASAAARYRAALHTSILWSHEAKRIIARAIVLKRQQSVTRFPTKSATNGAERRATKKKGKPKKKKNHRKPLPDYRIAAFQPALLIGFFTRYSAHCKHRVRSAQHSIAPKRQTPDDNRDQRQLPNEYKRPQGSIDNSEQKSNETQTKTNTHAQPTRIDRYPYASSINRNDADRQASNRCRSENLRACRDFTRFPSLTPIRKAKRNPNKANRSLPSVPSQRMKSKNNATNNKTIIRCRRTKQHRCPCVYKIHYFLRLIKTCPNTFFPYSIDIDENHI
jgi:hypothetical protein